MDLRDIITRSFDDGLRSIDFEREGHCTNKSHDHKQVIQASYRRIQDAVNNSPPINAAWLRWAYVNPNGSADGDRDTIFSYIRRSISSEIANRTEKVRDRIISTVVPLAVRDTWHQTKGREPISYRDIEKILRVSSYNKTYKPVYDLIVKKLKIIDSASLKLVENTTAFMPYY